MTKKIKTTRGTKKAPIKNVGAPVIIQPAPKQTIEIALYGLEEKHVLLNAKGSFEVGDVLYLHRKLVIKKIISTEGSTDLTVVAEPTRSSWSRSNFR